MMLILAMAPPVPLAGKIFVALLMLGLVGIAVRSIRGASFSGRSIGLAIAIAVGVVIVLEALLPSSYGERLKELLRTWQTGKGS
jgi:hypothetical protein